MSREYLEIYQNPGVDDHIELVEDGNRLYITVTNDWAGCTETGFGESGQINLTIDQAKEVYRFIGNFIGCDRS